MLVYRLCNEKEIDTILKTKDIYSIGKLGSKCSTLNTHNYEKDKKYLHFFLKECNISHLNPDCDKYICTYNIPDDIVLSHLGTGYYRNINNLLKLEQTLECAIETDLLDFTYLVKIEKIIKNYIYKTTECKEKIYTRQKRMEI